MAIRAGAQSGNVNEYDPSFMVRGTVYLQLVSLWPPRLYWLGNFRDLFRRLTYFARQSVKSVLHP